MTELQSQHNGGSQSSEGNLTTVKQSARDVDGADTSDNAGIVEKQDKPETADGSKGDSEADIPKGRTHATHGHLDPDALSTAPQGDLRWNDALSRTKLHAAAQAASSGEHNDAKARWHRAFLFAQQISGPKLEQESPNPDTPLPSESSKDANQGCSRDDDKAAVSQQNNYDQITRADTFDLKTFAKKTKEKAYNRDPKTGKRRPFKGTDGQKAIKVKKKLEEQHWLEMIDPKHRYGSNLKYYFEEWKLSDAEGNFFHWLDLGDGKELSLAKCPRDKLERENILYLSVEQRRHYLVYIDPDDGKFRWVWPAKETLEYCKDKHPLVETTGKKWTDLGEGRGVAPIEAIPEADRACDTCDDSVDDSSDSDSAVEATDEVGSDDSSSASDDSSIDIPEHARPGALRRTSSVSIPGEAEATDGPTKSESKAAKKEKGDVWIYVSDAEYRIYLGIKQKGYFQHSSFLAGGPITSAGTLVIKDGVLIACNPMSGHYRTKAVYFKRFVEELERQGADLSNVQVGKTELKLWFVERANTLHALKGKARRLAKGLEKKLFIEDIHRHIHRQDTATETPDKAV